MVSRRWLATCLCAALGAGAAVGAAGCGDDERGNVEVEGATTGGSATGTTGTGTAPAGTTTTPPETTTTPAVPTETTTTGG